MGPLEKITCYKYITENRGIVHGFNQISSVIT